VVRYELVCFLVNSGCNLHNFHHVCSCMVSVLFSNTLKETRTVRVDYVGKKIPRLVGTVKLVCTLCEFWWKVQLEYAPAYKISIFYLRSLIFSYSNCRSLMVISINYICHINDYK
jgi:hypothetical protein